MNDPKTPKQRPVAAGDVPPRRKPSVYPASFSERVAGREKRQLGEAFGLTNFGVNLTTLKPGAESALRHRHAKQDEFVYVLEGEPTLVTDGGETVLGPGMCVGFPAAGEAHHLINRSDSDVVLLEIGDRTAGDAAEFPDDDLKAVQTASGGWKFTHKDGRDY